MRCMWLLGLWLLAASARPQECVPRCERLFRRSARRVGLEAEGVRERLAANPKGDEAKSICWKFSDFDDCAQKCGAEQLALESKLLSERDFLRRKCKRVTAGSPYGRHFHCVHRFHTFLEVRCSSFAQEATRFRLLSKQAKRNATKLGRDVFIHETCRHLHYHSMCLANAVFSFCPQAEELFNRYTMRDYFLSFVVPKNDQLFTDRLLDHCQLYDFQKMAKDLFDSAKITRKRHTAMPVTEPMDLLVTTELSRVSSKKPRKLFSSDEDLMETPPNFHYSSAKYTKEYQRARENDYYRTTLKSGAQHEFDLITKPVELDYTFGENGEDIRVTYPDSQMDPNEPTTEPDRALTTRYDNAPAPDDNTDDPLTFTTQFGDYDEATNQGYHVTHVSQDVHGVDGSQAVDGGRGHLDQTDGIRGQNANGHRMVTRPDRIPTQVALNGFEINQEVGPGMSLGGLEDGSQFPEGATQNVDHTGEQGPGLHLRPPARNGDKRDDNYDDYNRQMGNHYHGNHANVAENVEESDEYDTDGPLLPFSKVHVAKIREFDQLDPNQVDQFEVRKGHGLDKVVIDQPEYALNGREDQVPGFGDMFRSMFTSVMSPTTNRPDPDFDKKAGTVLLLMVAYTVFFIAALIILISLVIAVIVRRKRQSKYNTYIVKKPPPKY